MFRPPSRHKRISNSMLFFSFYGLYPTMSILLLGIPSDGLVPSKKRSVLMPRFEPIPRRVAKISMQTRYSLGCHRATMVRHPWITNDIWTRIRQDQHITCFRRSFTLWYSLQVLTYSRGHPSFSQSKLLAKLPPPYCLASMTIYRNCYCSSISGTRSNTSNSLNGSEINSVCYMFIKSRIYRTVLYPFSSSQSSFVPRWFLFGHCLMPLKRSFPSPLILRATSLPLYLI